MNSQNVFKIFPQARSRCVGNQFFDEFFSSVLSNWNGVGWPLYVMAIYFDRV